MTREEAVQHFMELAAYYAMCAGSEANDHDLVGCKPDSCNFLYYDARSGINMDCARWLLGLPRSYQPREVQ